MREAYGFFKFKVNNTKIDATTILKSIIASQTLTYLKSKEKIIPKFIQRETIPGSPEGKPGHVEGGSELRTRDQTTPGLSIPTTLASNDPTTTKSLADPEKNLDRIGSDRFTKRI